MQPRRRASAPQLQMAIATLIAAGAFSATAQSSSGDAMPDHDMQSMPEAHQDMKMGMQHAMEGHSGRIP